ncbi:5-dehydro-4-deoxy-D-glucuronate isomerase [Saliniradius amylolyticus]|uniref:4-deoxy-L-threo-5-hexosulose-uronate ketol-isomerase n=1 Tax=Saliniradius amylolyticus TaxID=2183582 RepID=A0A2S2E5U6_9ALTE|nr:5-dehydro-4-deoxy-D-glucuronate isomerase [Saliniradius amylolyticus]AWL13036.1 5-dehydro-4-deoxy-D-glucuronate isomerase [Saliniradius amylolyticus]
MVDYEVKYAVGHNEFKGFGTDAIREHFQLTDLFVEDKIKLVYTHYDRFIVGAAVPVKGALELESIDPLKAPYFLARRELGAINVGGAGRVTVDGEVYEVGHKEALYIGAGNEKVVFESADETRPAEFYLNSAPAHAQYPVKKVGRDQAKVLELGSKETCNERVINQMIINGIVDTCQLQMGMTCLQPGSIWNTMPVHQHDRRMETYLYIDVPEDQAVCHFMGEPKETRHVWMANKQAVISPAWSIHSGAGTANYTFIWGMAGENLDYDDMDKYGPAEIR